LFGQHNDNAELDDDQESPVPTDEAGRVDTAPRHEESGEIFILRNLQQQMSSLQAQQTAQAAAPSGAESPAASTSSNRRLRSNQSFNALRTTLRGGCEATNPSMH
jgi:uncharacterized membrane protein YccC